MRPEQIMADLARAADDFDGVSEELQECLRMKVRTAETMARLHHVGMMHAHALEQREEFRGEVRLYLTLQAAEQIAEEAVSVAEHQPACATLLQQIEEICNREGLAPNEAWQIGEGPEDYEALNEEFDKQTERVRSTVLAFVLRRYDFAHYADLYEQDRVSYEVDREIGRRMMQLGRRDDLERAMDKLFKDKWGKEAWERVHAKVEEVRRSIGD